MPDIIPWEPHSQRGAAGFILPATLAAIVILGLAAAYFAGRVDELREGARQLQQWSESEREAFSVHQALMYQASIVPASVHGIAVDGVALRPDGRAYRLSDNHVLRVQDERGLLPILAMEPAVLRRLLTHLEVPAERFERLSDTLQDFIDWDDLRRLNGAEAREYAEAGLPPPPNDFLRSRDDLRMVLGWRELIADLDRRGGDLGERFLTQFTAARHGGININAAPPLVLAALPGFDAAKISALIDQRTLKPFETLGELAPFTNGRLDEELVWLVGANTWRATHAKEGLPFLLECQIVFTPAAKDRPAFVRECRRRPRSLFAPVEIGEFSRTPRADQNISKALTTSTGSRQRATPVSPVPIEWLARAAGLGPR